MSTARRIRLIHWHQDEADARAETLRRMGYTVNAVVLRDGKELRALGTDPPAAIVVDLSRLPSQGREVGVALRHAASTRRIPLVFVGGNEAKVSRIRQLLPDATYTTWPRLDTALRKAITTPPSDPIATASVFAGYSGTPLPKKLGIKPGSVVALVGAPPGFDELLGTLPEGAKTRRGLRGAYDLAIWFVRSARDLEGEIRRMATGVPGDGLWIAWPKKASGVVTDVSEPLVRRTGLANGLVDYKICAIDQTWSGLRFARRKPGGG